MYTLVIRTPSGDSVHHDFVSPSVALDFVECRGWTVGLPVVLDDGTITARAQPRGSMPWVDLFITEQVEEEHYAEY